MCYYFKGIMLLFSKIPAILIDSENVGSTWTSLLDNKDGKFELYICVTENAKSLNFTLLKQLTDEHRYKVNIIECKPGKNSLDFYLSSYLGYLIGKNKHSSYTVVSQDTGYDSVIEYWCNEGYDVKRINTKPEVISKKALRKRQRRNEFRNQRNDFRKDEKKENRIPASQLNQQPKQVQNQQPKQAQNQPFKAQPKQESSQLPVPVNSERRIIVKDPNRQVQQIGKTEPVSVQPKKEENRKPEVKQAQPENKEIKEAVSNKQEPVKKQEPAKQQEAAQKKTQPALKPQPKKKESEKEETSKKQKPKKQETVKQEAPKQETVKAEAKKEEAPKTEVLKKEESPKQEPVKEETKKAEAKKDKPKKTKKTKNDASLQILKEVLKDYPEEDIDGVKTYLNKVPMEKRADKNYIYRGLVRKFKAEKGLAIYTVLKKDIDRYYSSKQA